MQKKPQHLPPLAEYIDGHSLLTIPTVNINYPTRDSLNWFVRRNRDALVEGGALILVSGRLLFHAELFQAAVVEIGRKAMRIGGDQ